MAESSSADNPVQLREALVDAIKPLFRAMSAPIEAAFRAIERHHFLPGVSLAEAYSDDAIVTQRIHGVSTSSSSQPSLMAIMLHQLHLDAGNRVLEIGTGPGYNAALMGRIVGDTGRVTTVEIDTQIANRARARLGEAGLQNVSVIAGDGRRGYAPDAPYDRIIVTAAAPAMSPEWWEQLAPGGFFVGPIFWRNAQLGVGLRKVDDKLVSESVLSVRFMSLRDEGDNGVHVLPESEFNFVAGDSGVDAALVARLLRMPGEVIDTGLVASRNELHLLHLWLALRSARSCSICALAGDRASPVTFPCALEKEAFGLVSPMELCLVGPSPGEVENSDGACRLSLYGYGAGEELKRQLREEIATWDVQGRCLNKVPHVTVVRGARAQGEEAGVHCLEKDGFSYLVEWV
jgi:protein-L-isoaspartate(D-aspartate) O-methyltransferase